MTITVSDTTAGFSENAIGRAPGRSRTQLKNPPFIACESSSGLIHYIPSIRPWGCVVPMELFDGAPFFIDSLRVAVSVNERDFQIGDQVRVQWQAIGGSGKGYQSLPQTVVSFSQLHFAVPDETASQFEGDRVEVIFVIQRETAIPSPSLYMTFAPALIQTAPISLEGVTNGVLEIDKHPDGVELTIPRIENLRTNNAIEMYWKELVDDGQGNLHPVPWCDYQRKLTVSPKSPLKFRIEPSVYQEHRGKDMHLFCSLFLGSGMVPGLSYGMGSRGTLEFKLI